MRIDRIRYALPFTLFLSILACRESPRKEGIKKQLQTTDTPISKPSVTENKFDTSAMSKEDRIKKLIEISALKQFESSRQQLVDQGSQYQYNISEIQKSGSSYTYTVTVPYPQIQMSYLCIPTKGEFSHTIMGEAAAVEAQYKQLKVQNNWDNCSAIPEGERCESDVQSDDYPIKTHLKLSITYINSEHYSLTFQRISKPILQ